MQMNSHHVVDAMSPEVTMSFNTAVQSSLGAKPSGGASKLNAKMGSSNGVVVVVVGKYRSCPQ